MDSSSEEPEEETGNQNSVGASDTCPLLRQSGRKLMYKVHFPGTGDIITRPITCQSIYQLNYSFTLIKQITSALLKVPGELKWKYVIPVNEGG